jgi:ABC-2 type transport system permease protein
VPLPEELDRPSLERALEAGLKRFSKGFLKTIAVHAPAPEPAMAQFGLGSGGERFRWLRETFSEEHNLIDTDLAGGQVPSQADLLMLLAPQELDEKQLFAVDQFLMRGGTVVLASSPFAIDTQGSLAVRPQTSGLEDWLDHHGITLEKEMVLDPQNAAFPIPVDRQIGGFVVRETQLVDYPYFVDVRGDSIEQESGLAAGVAQVTLTWPSPITLDADKNQQRQLIRLLESSDRAWTSDSLDIQPDYASHGALGFGSGDQTGRQLLALAVEGRFDSFFKDKASPLAAPAESPAAEAEAAADDPDSEPAPEPEPVVTRVIERSPESARIILFGSNSFLSDEMLDLAAAGLGTRYLAPVDLLANAIDWSLEDRGLLAIRGRAQFSRTLVPLDRNGQVFWEYLNYALAFLGLLVVWLLRRQVRQRAALRYAALLNG